MTTAVARKDEWRSQIISMQPEFANALPPHVPVERFVRATQTAVMNDPELLSCDRKSLFQAVMQAAECGLMPNGRDAALVRFKRQVQFIPMVGGLLRLMRNSGEVGSLVVDVVCAHDHFDFALGSEPFIEHRPTLNNRGGVIGAYAVLKTKDGATYMEIMGRAEIEKVQKVSRAQNGPWSAWFEEMAKKTVLRRLAKRCPLSTDRLEDALAADNAQYDLNAIEQISDRREALHTALLSPDDEPAPDDNDAEERAPSEDAADSLLDSLRKQAAKAADFAALDKVYTDWKAAVADSASPEVIADMQGPADEIVGSRRTAIRREQKAA